jgi:hypothetical protein
MSNLLKITTKPIKISVQVEKGKYIKVEHVVKLQSKIKQQSNFIPVKRNESIQPIHSLPKNVKLIEPTNNINTIIQKSITHEETNNVAVYHQNSTSIKVEPIQNETEIKYQPSDLNFIVSQYSEIQFEYVGDPIYIPESANPNKRK